MADTIYAPDPWSALAAQHSDIRREGSVERGEIRFDVATRASDVRQAVLTGDSDIRRDQVTIRQYIICTADMLHILI